MTVVRLTKVSKSFGALDVLHEASMQVDHGWKVGVVGENGTGKTTLFKLITGELHQDDGEVDVHGASRVSCLEQSPEFDPHIGARAEVLSSRPDLLNLESRIDELAALISVPADDKKGRSVDRLLTLHAEAMEEFERLGGHEFEATTARVLAGLGLSEQEQGLPMGSLSGGQRSRVALAKVLLEDPDLLLLDEPTNHLDIQATEWLQAFLTSFQGAVLVISHDRYFLDAVCQRTVEVEDLQLSTYVGGYTAYVEQKERELAAQAKAYEHQQRELKRQEEYIRWRMQQGRDKSVRAGKARAKLIAKIERIERPTLQRRRPMLKFVQPRSGSNDILMLSELSKAYDGKPLFSDLSLLVNRGNRIGIVGPNGSGKTTLMRIILGEQSASSGQARLGPNIQVGYYSQGREDLHADRTVMDHVRDVRPDIDIAEMRSFLARFLFFGDSVFLRIETLSGGERSRVALARMILQRPDFLMLDEPTNHLDIPSREVFEDALIDYAGTLLIASHDRYFLDQVVEQILVIEDGRAEFFHGNYTALATQRAEQRAKAEEELARQRAAERRARLTSERARPKTGRRPPHAKPEDLEAQIMAVEARLAELTDRLADPNVYGDGDAVRALQVEYAEFSSNLKGLYARYEEAVGL